MAEGAAWRLVKLGLELKLLALGLFLGLPALAAAAWAYQWNPRWLLAGLAVAATPDLAGRLLCLAAPIAKTLPIALSVVFQLSGLFVLAMLGFTGGAIELAIGLGVAGCLQFAAAVLFTVFLRHSGEDLGRPEVTERADALQARLARVLMAGTGFSLVLLIALAVAAALVIITCGAGLYVAVPVLVVVLLPVALLLLWVVGEMYWAYGSAMTRLRTAIQTGKEMMWI